MNPESKTPLNPSKKIIKISTAPKEALDEAEEQNNNNNNNSKDVQVSGKMCNFHSGEKVRVSRLHGVRLSVFHSN